MDSRPLPVSSRGICESLLKWYECRNEKRPFSGLFFVQEFSFRFFTKQSINKIIIKKDILKKRDIKKKGIIKKKKKYKRQYITLIYEWSEWNERMNKFINYEMKWSN